MFSSAAVAKGWQRVGDRVKAEIGRLWLDFCFSSKALLRQPGGFEGLTFVVELADTHDDPVPDREQLVVGRANLGATHCPAAHLGCLDQYLIVSAVDDPLDVISVVIEALQPFL